MPEQINEWTQGSTQVTILCLPALWYTGPSKSLDARAWYVSQPRWQLYPRAILTLLARLGTFAQHCPNLECGLYREGDVSRGSGELRQKAEALSIKDAPSGNASV